MTTINEHELRRQQVERLIVPHGTTITADGQKLQQHKMEQKGAKCH